VPRNGLFDYDVEKGRSLLITVIREMRSHTDFDEFRQAAIAYEETFGLPWGGIPLLYLKQKLDTA